MVTKESYFYEGIVVPGSKRWEQASGAGPCRPGNVKDALEPVLLLLWLKNATTTSHWTISVTPELPAVCDTSLPLSHESSLSPNLNQC